jgi:hypothetical protein
MATRAASAAIGTMYRCARIPRGMPSTPPANPTTVIDVSTMVTTWRGVIPIDLSMPKSRRRSRTLSTTVLKTPSAATMASSSDSTDENPTTVTWKSLSWPLSHASIAASAALTAATYAATSPPGLSWTW